MKENICKHLKKEKQGLNNQQFRLPYYDISGIEEEIKHLEKKSTSQDHSNDGKPEEMPLVLNARNANGEN